MGLVLLALRTYYIFSNFYYSFKTLKAPPPSSRNNGQPSVRALSQRKRDMKGCLTIWIIWCCVALYEAHVENIISIFIPFYDEIKSVILLILILARARVAEPLYLHVIRPLIKPYVPLVDPILEVVLGIVDFILLAVSLPFTPFISWWRRWKSRKSNRPSSEEKLHSKSNGYLQPPMDRDRPRSEGYDTSDQSRLPKPSVNPSRKSDSRIYASQQKHEIWNPPSSAYEDDGPPAYVASSGPPPPMPVPQPYIPPSQTDQTSHDWRAYPPFPSAYPPTPIAPSKVARPDSFRSERHQIYAVPENGHVNGAGANGHGHPPPLPVDGYDASSEQDFHMSLLSAREPLNPGSDGGLSDDMNMQGVQSTDEPSTATSTVSVEEEEDDDADYVDEEEDSFDITLRTPRPNPKAKYYTSHSRRVQSHAGVNSLDESMDVFSEEDQSFMDVQATPSRNRGDVWNSPTLAGQKRARAMRSPAKGMRSPRKGSSKIARPSTKSKVVYSARKRSKPSTSILAGLDSSMVESDEDDEEQMLEDISEDSEDSGDSSNVVVSKRRKVVRPSAANTTRRSPMKAVSRERAIHSSQRPLVAATRTSSLRAANARAAAASSKEAMKDKTAFHRMAFKAAQRDASTSLSSTRS